MRLAINGFGRIGRTVLRQYLTEAVTYPVEIVVINDIADPDLCAHLLAYDSTFGPFPGDVAFDGTALQVAGQRLRLTQHTDIRALDLSGVDVLLDCTGIAKTSDVAARGLEAGARSVLISGPAPGADATIVLGANEEQVGHHRVLSNASCTTNGLAPLAKLIDEIAGIERGHMTTIHCYTNSQPLVDAPRGDWARSRGGAQSMVPTTTSATKLIDDVLPHLAGRITGAAVRVPTASVSAVDFIVQLQRDITPDRFFQALRHKVGASAVLGWTDLPLVSSDLRARPESLVVAGPECRLSGQQLRVFGWYDNEWGFAARMFDIAARMAERD